MVKPEFFRHEHIGSMSFPARLLFIALWTIADRDGRLENRPARIKLESFPYDDIDVAPLIAELCRKPTDGSDPVLVAYEVDGRKYLQVTGFTKHQRPHDRETKSVIPPPEAGTRTNLGDVEHQPRLAQGKPRCSESESESESVPVTESVPVPVPEAHAAHASEPASRASDRKPRKAKPSGDPPRPRNDRRFDELWAHATKRWFEGVVTKYNRGRIAKVVHALMEYGADVSMVNERIANLRQHWRDIHAITPEALVKHWSLGANPPPPRLTPREQALEDAWKAMERSPEDVYGSEYASSNGAADGIGSDR